MPPLLPRKIGGSTNVSVDATSWSKYELTGLDAQGQVVPELNVKLIAGESPNDPVTLILPLISSLNNRRMTIFLNSNDYPYSILVQSQGSNLINTDGDTEFTTPILPNCTFCIVVGSANNWNVLANDGH